MGVDLGDKRTGLALGDSVTRLSSPVGVIEVPVSLRDGAELVERIAAEVRRLVGDQPMEIVVGLPVNMDGTEGPRAKIVRTLAAAIGRATGAPVHLFDERLTSAEADWSLAQSGLTHGQKKARRDAIAAAAILRGFLERRSEGPME